MAPGLARRATDQLAKEVEIAKQRRMSREEQAAKRGEGSHNDNKKQGQGQGQGEQGQFASG
eukprot:7207645-Pyramimonas_sp.AAC.1